ncbi:cyclin-like protein [Aulographum hederae CBS 113979]|uniref:Cyclin-like protein n=1 Tax=Aulographum hederae CBS 113979 TaxID=1176131 RepID=A0A6G1GRP4_9PEZI|nr:cyclin-like protein [Aulographum hederae CBS 113979]
MNEDDIYRASTQYRLWSFTPEKLAALRSSTNALATERVKAAKKRVRLARAQQLSSEKSAPSGDVDANTPKNGGGTAEDGNEVIDCLTVEEELKIIAYYCQQCLSIGPAEPHPMPSSVVGSAIQFIKRFYLSNSPMTYHPKDVMIAALFLVTKTDNFYIGLDKYVDKINTITGNKKMTREKVLAPEFLLTQALRFTFDVKHPFKGIRGAYYEMLAMIRGKYALLPFDERTPDQVAEQFIDLSDAKSKAATEARLSKAYNTAQETLNFSALLTDAYLLYTPPQIYLAALLLADEPLTLLFLDAKIPSSAPLKPKLLATLRACANVLTSINAHDVDRADLVRIDKKLHLCRNPEKKNLVNLNKAQKRDELVEGKLDDNVAKKRRMEREKNEREGDALFGGALPAATKTK